MKIQKPYETYTILVDSKPIKITAASVVERSGTKTQFGKVIFLGSGSKVVGCFNSSAVSGYWISGR